MTVSVPHSSPSITGFRQRIRDVLHRERSSLRPRHVVILAVDGIPYDLATDSWQRASTTKMISVFPTTSSTAWLSSLTGMGVDLHGVPGVVFRMPDRQSPLINVFECNNALFDGPVHNIFSDALEARYLPLSIVGDLEGFDCSWRSLLLRHSKLEGGCPFFTAPDLPAPAAVCRKLRNAILNCLQLYSQDRPLLIWCFLDADFYIHRHGYDANLIEFLAEIDRLAVELVERGAAVVAHSDHGLTPTRSDPAVEESMTSILHRYGCTSGGAGRTRWIYAKPENVEAVRDELVRELKAPVDVVLSDELFVKGSLAWQRVGEIILVAKGENFIAPHEYSFDHGSLTDRELEVPYSEWLA